MAKIISISFEKNEYETLKQIAKDLGFQSVQQMLKFALRNYLNQIKQNKANQQTLNQNQTIQTDQNDPEWKEIFEMAKKLEEM